MRYWNRFKVLPITAVAWALFCWSCSSQTEKRQSGGVEETDDGRVKSTIDAESDSEITVDNAAIAGTSLSVPAGTFAVDTEVFFEEGEAVGGEGLVAELGLGTDVELAQAGPAVVVSASQSVDATQPFTLAIPVGDATQLTQTRQLVIAYRLRKAFEGDQVFAGIITDVNLEGSVAKFQTRFFGAYQAVYSNVQIQAPVEKISDSPIVSKATTLLPYVGRWKSPCENDTDDPTDLRSETMSFLIGRDAMTVKGVEYDGIDCQGEPVIAYSFLADLKVVGNSQLIVGGQDVDLFFQKSFLTPYLQEVADELNRTIGCGTGWVAGETRRIDFSRCDLGGGDSGSGSGEQTTDSSDGGPPAIGETIYLG